MTKEETRLYNAAYHAKHRERHLAMNREWKAKNREAHRASAREWAKANRKRSNALKQAWKKRNPEATKRMNRRATPERLANHAARQSARNRALRKPDAAVVAVYRRCALAGVIPCYWCGVPTERGERHVDHVMPLSRGGEHVASNLVIACVPCNLSKNAKLPHEFMQGVCHRR